MANRRERRAGRSSKPPQGKPYKPPFGVEYNEFVGELGPAKAGTHTELHVRYGVRDEKYVDWSITLLARLGGLEDFKRTKKHLERRKLQRIDVSNSAIRHHKFDPLNPGRPPETTVAVPLTAGNYELVDQQYGTRLNELYRMWVAPRLGLDGSVEPHTFATFGFVEKNREPEFQDGIYSWVRNTVVSIDSDEPDDVIVERAASYFPGRPSTTAVWLPSSGRMKFMKIDPGQQPEEAEAALSSADDDSADTPLRVSGTQTMGMLVEYVNRGDSWIDGLS
ncbi:hypothetical protein [Nocardia sp. NPDC051570]|uniref:hypothetical protein n=1 Tax=Nocardia sp. NPDC051570 TaxID=3364324 RepID=UPI0037B49D78